MFAVAHVFLGLLLGLAFLGITGDRRVVPLCVIGALLPDLIDKPLALLVPALGSGRTIGHCIMFVFAVLLVALMLFHYRNTLLGFAFACGVFFHQIFDSMWQSLQTWFFPFLGPFPLLPVPDYTGYYLWLEIASPSEWLFLMTSLVIVAGMLGMMPSRPVCYQIGAGILGVMGIFLMVAGWSGQGGSLFAPTYTATTSALAGVLAIAGAAALIHMSKRGIRYT
jgi:hypothetical protein